MKILYINLDSRPDRWQAVSKEFERVGLSVERFPAITGDNRPLAFNKSVYECMRLAAIITTVDTVHQRDVMVKIEVNESLLLLEDDVVFDIFDDFNVALILDYIKQFVPLNFLTLHLGCNIIGTDTTIWQMPEKANGLVCVAKLHNCWQSHATLYSSECVKYIIENFPYHTDEYEKEGLIIFDEWLRTNVLPMGRSYLLNPMICYQKPDFSDIWNVPADYSGAHKQGNLWLKQNL